METAGIIVAIVAGIIIPLLALSYHIYSRHQKLMGEKPILSITPGQHGVHRRGELITVRIEALVSNQSKCDDSVARVYLRDSSGGTIEHTNPSASQLNSGTEWANTFVLPYQLKVGGSCRSSFQFTFTHGVNTSTNDLEPFTLIVQNHKGIRFEKQV